MLTETSSAITFKDQDIIPKLSRIKAKLKFINIGHKQLYENNIKKFNERESFSLQNDEDSKVFPLQKINCFIFFYIFR